MIGRIRKYSKGIALFLVFNLLQSVVFPTVSLALTSGPSQPEVQSFEPVTTNQMVDPFTGDFTYNIPLFNLPGPDGGYPFNLAYHSGIGMDQEASWVGLGWTLNPGAINRSVHNLPDEFDGFGNDQITLTEDMKPNWTLGVNGGVGAEIWGFDGLLGGAGASLSFSTGIYYNSYKGVGKNLGIGLTPNFKGAGDKFSAGLGLSVSLDTQEGIGADADLTLSSKGKGLDKVSTNLSVGTGYNSRRGLTQISTGLSFTKWSSSYHPKIDRKGNVSSKRKNKGNFGGGKANIPLSNSSFSPQVYKEFSGKNIALSFKTGVDIGGAFGSMNLGGFYNEQGLKNPNIQVSFPAVGYLNLSNYEGLDAIGTHPLMDVGRDSDGQVYKTTKILAAPSLNFDSYLVVGQGIGQTFRAFRSDIGVARNQSMVSKMKGGNIGFELGIPLPDPVHNGLGATYNWSKTESGKWATATDNISANIGFSENTTGNDFENYYFKTYGEQTIDEGGKATIFTTEDPVYFELSRVVGSGSLDDQFSALGGLRNESNTLNAQMGDPNLQRKRTQRRPRGTNIIGFTNEEILVSSNEILPEYDIKVYSMPTHASTDYYDKNSLTDYTPWRTSREKNHFAGYSALNNSGERYIYALPAYNNFQTEYSFSLDPSGAVSRAGSKLVDVPTTGTGIDYKFSGTEEYYHEQTMPAYAHSYLLTSILGSDYVDIDNNGPSDNDLGYWVKFNYAQAHSSYRWRAPFKQANLLEGYKTSTKDDKGAFLFGEKEIWHLATVETKTHIAEFTILDSRTDGYGTSSIFQNSPARGANSFQLDHIDIYSKSERYNSDGTINLNAVPIKTIHFHYTQELCKGIPNSSGATGSNGKLTLTELWFTYKGNNRGSLNKYKFDYHQNIPAENPGYDNSQVDRWGNYKPNNNNPIQNVEFPYVDQFNTSPADIDKNAAVWNLKGITLPSGGTITIDYESDSYAYIQDKVAMQMTPITGIYGTGSTGPGDNDIVCDGSTYAAPIYRRVYFKLENPVATSAIGGSSEQSYIYNNYIDPSHQVYFKIKTTLTNLGANLQEYVGGYADIIDAGLYSDGTQGTDYTDGWIELDWFKMAKKSGKTETINYHPFQIAAWQHLQTNQPDIIHDLGNSYKGKKSLSKAQIGQLGAHLIGVIPDIIQTFQGMYNWMHSKHWGKYIVLQDSYLRLKTPDKVKYGGGCRVKQISITDNWDQSTTNELPETYGQHYLYTTTETTGGVEISSGVAAYEPTIGGDEIALKEPVKYAVHTPLKTSNAMYSEVPVNESLYPAPEVGYSKVTVMSINTYSKLGNNSKESTTGKVVHEYYTAKDFPVKTDYTNIDFYTDNTKIKQDLIIPVPGIGTTSIHKLAATQGFSITLNDMHGKLKKITNYGQDELGNFVEDKPLSSVEYFYKKDANGNLDNYVDVITNDDVDQGVATTSSLRLGYDVDFVVDMRENKTTGGSAGFNLNTETIVFLPAFLPWPAYSYSKQQLQTITTNKIIHQTGILVKTEAFDGQSKVTTENLKFDPLTGEPLLTKTTNNFDNDIYNYAVPARWGYDGMGEAYKNIKYKFEGTITTFSTNIVTLTGASSDLDHLSPGDELLAYTPASFPSQPEDQLVNDRFTYLKNESGTIYLYHKGSTPDNIYHFIVSRSAYRNHLTAKAASYTTLGLDPTTNRHSSVCSNYDETYPTGVENQVVSTLKTKYYVMELDKVLSANANTYTDQWVKDFRDYRISGVFIPPSSLNPYATGKKGIWKADRTFTYVDQRQQTVDATGTVDISNDGVMNNVGLYNWGYNNSNPCESNWKLVNKVTKTNPYSFELENKDILGRYSSALYGYGGRMATAVAANARYEEIGFEGFEEYSVGQTISQFDLTTSNLDFYNNYSSTSGPNNNGTYEIEKQIEISIGYDQNMYLDIDYNDFLNLGVSTGDVLDLVLTVDVPNVLYGGVPVERIIREIPFSSVQEVVATTSPYFGKAAVTLQSAPVFSYTGVDRPYSGYVGIKQTINVPANTINNASISSQKAHTGKNSLRVSTSNSIFDQQRMDLIPGKKYQFSTWVSKQINDWTSYANSGIQITFEYLDQNGQLISSESTTAQNFKGKIIEGWQKVDVEFIFPSGAKTLRLKFTPGVVEGTTAIAYYDDIRIFPSDGLIKTYVYNLQDYKLYATLDNNNYATFYYYDESGNLFLVKQETNEGIYTIKESRSHLKE